MEASGCQSRVVVTVGPGRVNWREFRECVCSLRPGLEGPETGFGVNYEVQFAAADISTKRRCRGVSELMHISCIEFFSARRDVGATLGL